MAVKDLEAQTAGSESGAAQITGLIVQVEINFIKKYPLNFTSNLIRQAAPDQLIKCLSLQV